MHTYGHQSKASSIPARVTPGRVQESILRLYSVPDSLANATKHSAEVLASLAILGASHGAAQWLTPWRDLSIKRDCTELGHYDRSDDDHQHVVCNSF